MRKMYFMLMALAFVGLSLSVSSCSDSGDDDNPPPSSKELKVTLNPTTLADFPVIGGMQTVNVKVQPENTEWTAVAAEDWATIDRTGNKFTITVGENTGDDRTNSVTVTVKGLEPVVLPFKQLKLAKTLDIAGTFSYTAATGAKNLTITSNTAWTITTTYNEGNGWLTYSVASGTGNATVAVTAAANTAAARTAVIKVQATNDASLFKTVDVSQAAYVPAAAFIDELVGAWTHKGLFWQQDPDTKEWDVYNNTHEITITKVNATTIKIDGVLMFEKGSTFHNAINATVNNANKTITIAHQKFYGGTESFDGDGWDVYFTPYLKDATHKELWGTSFTNIPVTGSSGSYSIDLKSTVKLGDVNGAPSYTSYLPLTIAPGGTPATSTVYWYSQVITDAVLVQGAPAAAPAAAQALPVKVEPSPALKKMIATLRAK